ncbi:polysaccharide deacetylase family protein [Marinobacterium lutimaris]|uniref:Polysaccharide deacetylase n=1 Tax=Marinobacterium lutimaris TaxID=568106 RepID=A0A1H6D7U2_9GAMM|nr:polysaccharide deacetylase family protein [Marinobacterium lutimaris]SEG81154.1 hypothetical protein SAMN05444390_105139 [Marinobacterium lutimaris]
MADWKALETELALWRESGQQATLWWRDDDAERPSDALEQLIEISDRFHVPLALATIPAGAEASLAERVKQASAVSVLQHGFSHLSHVPPSERKCELGNHRPLAEITDELGKGQAKLAELFGDAFLPVLVPPWNRLGEQVIDALPGLGFTGLSTLGPRSCKQKRLIEVNVHADLINWKAGRCFAGEERSLAQIITHLQQRRLGEVDSSEPTGVMTHHLVHDEGVWAFLPQLFDLTLKAGAHWCTAKEIFS